MANTHISIGDRIIGPDTPPYVIAELSANHLGEIDRAFKIMEAAAEAGADAVKLQTYTPDTMTIDHDSDDFLIKGGLWDGYRLYDLYKSAYTPWEWHDQLFAKGRELGIQVFSSPFDETAVDLLTDLDAPAFKIASFELIDIPLIERVAATGKPLIMSTGMANIDEIEEAVAAARGAGCKELALLHCVSGYPTPLDESNLRTITDLAERFDVVIGLSDHTLEPIAPMVAVALGACIIEKHFTLNRADGGADAVFSLEPEELRELCQSCKAAWTAMGSAGYSRKSSEENNILFRRSIYAVADIKAGDLLTNENIRSIRPGYGLPPKHFPKIIGTHATQPIPRGTPIQWDLLK